MPFYSVYILASRRHGTLYVGVTNELIRQVEEHQKHLTPGFTSRYGVHRLVWYETFGRIEHAIRFEKQLKRWRRDWKVNLIERENPYWQDLMPGLLNPSWAKVELLDPATAPPA
jgi:putative endonuclease